MDLWRVLPISLLAILPHLLTLVVTSSSSPVISEISSSATPKELWASTRLTPEVTNSQMQYVKLAYQPDSKMKISFKDTTNKIPSPPVHPDDPFSYLSSSASAEESHEAVEEIRVKRYARRLPTTEVYPQLGTPQLEQANIINAPLFRTTSAPRHKRCPPGTRMSHSGRCRRVYK